MRLQKNAEIYAGRIIGGFAEMDEKAYWGVNAAVRNRVNIGENAKVGMGAVITKGADDNATVADNPEKSLIK